MKIDNRVKPADLSKSLDRMFELAARKVRAIDRSWDTSRGTPVFTVEGKYTSRGWTEWTQGFQYGCALLAFDADRDADRLSGGGYAFKFIPYVALPGADGHVSDSQEAKGHGKDAWRELLTKLDDWQTK